METNNKIVKEKLEKTIDFLESAAWELMLAHNLLRDDKNNLIARATANPAPFSPEALVKEATQIATNAAKIEAARKAIEELKGLVW